MLRKLLLHVPIVFNSGGARRYGLGIAWGPRVSPTFNDSGVVGPKLVRRWQLRLSWGQVALWRDDKPLINWLNPLVWCHHGGYLHLRAKPIERAF